MQTRKNSFHSIQNPLEIDSKVSSILPRNFDDVNENFSMILEVLLQAESINSWLKIG